MRKAINLDLDLKKARAEEEKKRRQILEKIKTLNKELAASSARIAELDEKISIQATQSEKGTEKNNLKN